MQQPVHGFHLVEEGIAGETTLAASAFQNVFDFPGEGLDALIQFVLEEGLPGLLHPVATIDEPVVVLHEQLVLLVAFEASVLELLNLFVVFAALPVLLSVEEGLLLGDFLSESSNLLSQLEMAVLLVGLHAADRLHDTVCLLN